MLRSYFKIIIQNIIRHKVFTLINILGLSVGVACSILLLIWGNHELSYNKYHKNIDRIGQVFEKYKEDGEVSWTMPYPLATAIKDEIPEVENACRYLNWRSICDIGYEGTSFRFSFDYTQNDFFRIFSFDFIEGSPENALIKENSIIVTQKTAQKLFGNHQALGKIVEYKKLLLEVSGVIKDNPTNSQFQFDILSNIQFLKSTGWDLAENKWNTSSYSIYVLLKENASYEVFEKKLNELKEIKGNEDSNLFYYPFREVYLRSPLGAHLVDKIKLFMAGGLLLLIIASINYVNLSIARYSQRLKEIGIRRIAGANRGQIATQQIGESLVYASISSYVGLLLADILLPLFNYLSGNSLIFPWSDLAFWVEYIALTIGIGIVTGVYPAVILSSYKPVNALKNILYKGQRGSYLRNALVLFQFACTTFFIICALLTAKQNSYMASKNLGFSKDNIINVYFEDTVLSNKYQAIKDELLLNSIIVDVTKSSDIPVEIGSFTNDVAKGYVDDNFFEFFNIEFISGSPFVRGRKYSEKDVIVNQTLEKMLANNSPSVKWIKDQNVNFIGVVKDYHIQSLKNTIKPLLIRKGPSPEYSHHLFVKHRQDENQKAHQIIKQVIDKVIGACQFKAFSLHDIFREKYQNERRETFIFIVFSIITIILSCLGVLGLAIYSVESRKKEIGIRKANGATHIDIIVLLTSNFGKWIVIAFALSAIPAYYYMNGWLQNFAYRTELSWWVFAIALIIAFIVALITIVLQSWRTASKNPVEALRYE